jgi:hypothetical protein
MAFVCLEYENIDFYAAIMEAFQMIDHQTACLPLISTTIVQVAAYEQHSYC